MHDITAMRLAVVQHHPAEGPGELWRWAASHGVELIVYRADLDQRPPVSAAPVVLLGGPYVAAAGPDWLQRERQWLREVVALGAPVLAICLGAQLLALTLGGDVRRMDSPETGWTAVQFDDGQTLDVLQWHEYMFSVPPGATLHAQSAGCAHQMFALGGTRIGLQFHPEWNADTLAELNACFGAESPLPRAADPARFAQVSAWLQVLLDDWYRECGNGRPA